MGNHVSDISEKEITLPDRIKNELQQIKFYHTNEDKIQSRIDSYNKYKEKNEKEGEVLKIARSNINKEKLLSFGTSLIKICSKEYVDENIYISLPQAVLTPDTAIIDQTHYENYLHSTSSCFILFEHLNQSERKALFQKLWKAKEKEKVGKNKSLDLSPRSAKHRLKTVSNSPSKNSFLNDQSLTSANSMSKTNRTFERTRNRDKSADDAVKEKRVDILKNKSMQKHLTDLLKLENSKIKEISGIDNSPTKSKMQIEASNKKESKTSPKANQEENNFFNIIKVNMKAKIQGKDNSQVKGKNSNSSTPTVNYKLDMKKLVNMYKNK